jgi:hypothetical protein
VTATAADLFADDIMRIIMTRLSVEIRDSGDGVTVMLVDTCSGMETPASRIVLRNTYDRLHRKEGGVVSVLTNASLQREW